MHVECGDHKVVTADIDQQVMVLDEIFVDGHFDPPPLPPPEGIK